MSCMQLSSGSQVSKQALGQAPVAVDGHFTVSLKNGLFQDMVKSRCEELVKYVGS